MTAEEFLREKRLMLIPLMIECKFSAHDKCYKLVTVRCGEAITSKKEGGGSIAISSSSSAGDLLKHTTNKRILKEEKLKSEV